MNDRFVTEPFAIAPDRLGTFKVFCKKHKLIVDNYLIDGVSLVGVRGSYRKHFRPQYNNEFIALLPQGGVLFYEIVYKYNLYWGLWLRRAGDKFRSIAIQCDDYFSVFADLNKVLAELVQAPPSDGVLFVSAAFKLNDKNDGSLKNLTALAEDSGCRLDKARYNANPNCFRLSGLATKKLDPRNSKALSECMSGGDVFSNTLFYFLTFQAGKCTGLQLYNKSNSYQVGKSDDFLSLLCDIPLGHGLEGFTGLNAQLVVEVCRQ
jgi:hypothetical protein